MPTFLYSAQLDNVKMLIATTFPTQKQGMKAPSLCLNSCSKIEKHTMYAYKENFDEKYYNIVTQYFYYVRKSFLGLGTGFLPNFSTNSHTWVSHRTYLFLSYE